MSVHQTSSSGSGSSGGGGLGSVFKSFTKSLKPTSNSSKNVVPVSINPTVVGGGQELQLIIQQLTTNSSNSVKLTALIKLTESISKYSISSIPEIWYLVHDLCDGRKKYPTNIRRQALKLCIECIKKDDNKGVGDKLNYFNDIVKYCRFKTGNGATIIDPDFDLFLEALVCLSDNARDIHDFVIYDDKHNLNVFLEESLIGFKKVSSKYKFQSDDQDKELLIKDREFSTLIKLIEFVKNCLNFNYTLLEETFVNAMIYRLLQIGRTSNKSILTSIISSLNIIFSFGSTPVEYFASIIQFLSSIYGSSIDEDLNLLVWDSITSLCLQDSIHLVISTLCGNISNPDLQRSRTDMNNSTIYSSIGAFQLIVKIQIKNSIEGTSLDFTYFKIIRAIKSALSFNIPVINTSYLRTFDKLLAKESYFDNFGLKFQDSMDKVLPFQLWYSSNCSIYDCLRKLKVNSDQDIDFLQSICISLCTLYENHELTTPKDKLIDFFMGNSPYLPDVTISFILRYYDDEKLCSFLNPFWKDFVLKILNQFYYQVESDQIRLECLQVILQGLKTSHAIFNKEDINYDLIIDIFKKSKRETAGPVLSFLTNELFSFVCLESSFQVFQQLISIIMSLYIEKRPARQESIYSRSFVTLSSQASSVSNSSIDFLHGITRGIIQVFLKCILKNPERASQCFNILIDITDTCPNNGEILLIISKLFVRLRVTTEGYMYVTQPNDMMGLASAFKRDVASNHEINANVKWVYPESVDYLDEKYFNQVNKQLLLFKDEEEIDKYYIDIKKWVHLGLRIMKEFIDWELYSFVWGHSCWQLSNMELFLHCQEEVIEFRRIICEQLTLNLPSQLKFNNELNKSDLQVVFVRSLSSLIGYHDLFSKYDQDQIINSLIFGLEQSWEKTAIPCINILTVCCFEIPLSVKKFLTTILMKLQTTITSSVTASCHILEFLMSLVHLPILTSNFTIEEFKRVFGIAFKYIQYANDLRVREQSSNAELIQKHGVEAQVEQTPSTQSIGDLTPILSQYILMISYNVISSWFLKINMSDRKKLSSFIIKNLINCNNDTGKLHEQTIGFIDFIIRFTYSDLPLTIIGIDKPGENRVLNRWIMGNSILSIETDLMGDAEINIRRPTGVTKLTMTMKQQEHEKYPITPNFYLLQLFDHLQSKNKPIPIIEDSIVSRALSVLDRIPGVEFHKIGIIYIGKGQTTEHDVLLNKVGSLAYHQFLNKIGNLIKLKNNREIYVGGLDIENDLDGEFSLYWRDKTTQLIFHVTTMMNTCDDLHLKKRHIGNDYVNIFFDESGQQEFNFNLIKSQFNFLNIVITPCAISSDVSIDAMRIKEDSIDIEDFNKHTKFYKVKIYRRSGVPAIFSTCHFKLISQDKLPEFIRNLSILSNEFAHIWHSQGIYTSNWSQRVKQLQIIINKSMDNYNAVKQEQLQEQEHDHDEDDINTTQSFFDQITGTTTSRDTTTRESNHEYKFEYGADDEQGVKLNELYQLVEFNSYTC